MLTVGEVAKKLNISTQAIYLKINSSMTQELAPYVKEIAKGNRKVKMIESEGVELIRLSLDSVVDEVVDNNSVSLDKDLLKILQDTIAILQEQLLAKDLQIQNLNKFIDGLQESNKNNQILIHRQQDVKSIEENKSLWDKIKGSFK